MGYTSMSSGLLSHLGWSRLRSYPQLSPTGCGRDDVIQPALSSGPRSHERSPVKCRPDSWQADDYATFALAPVSGTISYVSWKVRPLLHSGRRLHHFDQQRGSRHDRVDQLESVAATPLAPTRLPLVHFTTSAYCWVAVCPLTFVP